MKYHIIFAAGFFLTIIPFIGVPTAWKLTSVAIIGACLMAAALIRYYTAYSLYEYGQTHTDGGPNDSENAASPEDSEQYAEESPKKTEESFADNTTAQPSPYYNPKDTPQRKTRVRRIKKAEPQDEGNDEDDEEDDSYTTKNKYEEEHSF